MPSAADYLVLRDSTFTLDNGESKELSCFLPEKITNTKLIIAYQAKPLPSPPFSAVATISIKPKFHSGTIESVEIRGETVHGLWETFPTSQTSTTISNIFIFKCEQGKVHISDVVHWLQRNI